MKKTVLALFLVLALMLSLCACGAKTEAPAPEAAPSAASNEEPAAPVEEVQAPTATDFEVTDLLGMYRTWLPPPVYLCGRCHSTGWCGRRGKILGLLRSPLYHVD